MNTFCIPPENKTNNLATRNNYDGTQSKQIDYFAISSKNKNWVKNIPNKHPANPHFITQHRMLKIYIKTKLKNPKNIIKDADVQYDIYKLRKEPKTMEKTLDKILQNHTHNINNWGKLTNIIKTALISKFPKTKDKQNQKRNHMKSLESTKKMPTTKYMAIY